MNDYDYNITPYKQNERDFFSDPTILVNAILGKEFDAALSRLRSNPEEVSIWMVIESPQLSNEISSPSAKTNSNEQNGSRKRVSLRNLYTDNDAEEEDAEEDGGKIYLLRRLPLHFACSVIPDEKFGTMSDDAKLEELILKMIQVDPALCKREDNEGRLPLHEAVQNDVSTSIIESLLRNFPQASQICDAYGRTPISVRKIRSNSKSIRLDDDPIYQLLSKDSNYWLNETKSTNLLDDISVCDDDELENNENCVTNMASKAMGFGKTFGSRHEEMIARKSAEKLTVGGILSGDDTPAVGAFNLDATDHDHTSPRFNLRTVFANSKESKNNLNSSDMAIISSVDQNELNTAEPPRRRPRKGNHPFSRSAPPSQSKSRTPQLEETSDTAAPSQREGATALRRSAIPEKDQPEEISSNDSLPLQTRKQVRSHRSAKSDEKQSKFNYTSENSSTSTSDDTGSHKKLNKKYQKLKHDFRKIQSTNHSLAKQMRKMQVEKEEQLHRMKSRTKTTISNLRSDVAKLKDEKFVLMAAMEELKNKCDHFELQNDLLRNMYESSKISAELSDDIHELNVNQKEIVNVPDASDVDNKNDAMLTVSEDKSVLYTESSKSSCIRASNSSSSTMQQLGLTAIRKVQAATMKLSGHDLGTIRSTIDTSFTEYTATSSGTLALTAAMKMIELAKHENDDDIQTIASEALAVNAKVSSNEVNQQRYQYIQEENDKLKSELKNAEYEIEDLEDLVYRLKIAVSELSSKKTRRIRASDATRPEQDEQSVPNNSAVEEQRRSPSDRSNDLAYASVHARFEAIRSNYAPMGLDYASAPSRFSAMESRIPSTDLDKLRSPSSITSSEFGTHSGKLANEQKMPATDPNEENDEENEWSEDSIDYKDEYLALLKALESSDRYATESFLTKRVRDLELQLSVTDGRKSISNGPDNEETSATPKEIN